MKRTLLIDGDEYIHVASAAVEYEARWDDENIILASNVVQAWDTFQTMLNTTTKAIGGEQSLLFAFSDKENFRKEVYPLYKAKRGGRKPLCFKALKERVHDTYECHTLPKLEADDILGIFATNGKHENPVIVSQDKDMLTIPTNVWREGTLHAVSIGDADFHWLKQTLSGDTSDNYGGCPGVGPVTAEKLLNEFIMTKGGFNTQEAWKAVVAQFVKKGLVEIDAVVQARCARILRAEDWDNEKMEVKLWAPQ